MRWSFGLFALVISGAAYGGQETTGGIWANDRELTSDQTMIRKPDSYYDDDVVVSGCRHDNRDDPNAPVTDCFPKRISDLKK